MESRDVRGVRSVVLDAPGLLVVRQGESAALHVQADAELLRYVVTRVEEGTLVIRLEAPGRVVPRTPLQYHLTVEALERLRVAGEGDVEVIGGLRTTGLDLSLAGSGEASIAGLETRLLRLSIAGSGGARVDGSADEQSISIMGSGGVDARQLESRRTTVRIAGSGSAIVRTADRLEIALPGGGGVRYFGDPAVTLLNDAEVGGRVHRVVEGGSSVPTGSTRRGSGEI